MYVLPQLLGATLASMTLRVLFNEQDRINSTVTQYSAPTTDLEAIIWEFIISFTLMFTICGVATDHRAVIFIFLFCVCVCVCVRARLIKMLTFELLDKNRAKTSLEWQLELHFWLMLWLLGNALLDDFYIAMTCRLIELNSH